mmetsp:Transcript_3987/g.10403  ORF Transcript_3987/g.10403 Transcript_3987/m.10403 type:complete len:241 (-) Transcript_3987:183-905(-)
MKRGRLLGGATAAAGIGHHHHRRGVGGGATGRARGRRRRGGEREQGEIARVVDDVRKLLDAVAGARDGRAAGGAFPPRVLGIPGADCAGGGGVSGRSRGAKDRAWQDAAFDGLREGGAEAASLVVCLVLDGPSGKCESLDDGAGIHAEVDEDILVDAHDLRVPEAPVIPRLIDREVRGKVALAHGVGAGAGPAAKIAEGAGDGDGPAGGGERDGGDGVFRDGEEDGGAHGDPAVACEVDA